VLLGGTGTVYDGESVIVTGVNYVNQLFTFNTANGTEIVTGSASGTVANLISIVPVDMWVPISLEYRCSQSEEWQFLNRTSSLPSQEIDPPNNLTNWEFRMRNIYVNQSTQNGFLRLRYLSLFPSLIYNSFGNNPLGQANPLYAGQIGQDPSTANVLIDNALEALAYYTAYDAAKSRGQSTLAKANLDSANMFANLIINVLVKNEQRTPTRSKRYTSGGYYFGRFNPPVESPGG
jgi:hypothetical protein